MQVLNVDTCCQHCCCLSGIQTSTHQAAQGCRADVIKLNLIFPSHCRPKRATMRRTTKVLSGWVRKPSTWGSLLSSLASWSLLHTSLCTSLRYKCTRCVTHTFYPPSPRKLKVSSMIFLSTPQHLLWPHEEEGIVEVEQSELCDGEISSMRRRGALLGSCHQRLWRFRKSWQTLNMTEHILVSAAVFIILRHNLLPFLQRW